MRNQPIGTIGQKEKGIQMKTDWMKVDRATTTAKVLVLAYVVVAIVIALMMLFGDCRDV